MTRIALRLSSDQQFSHFKERGESPADNRKTKDKAQRQRFIDAAREAGASEEEAVFDENLKRIAKPKPRSSDERDGQNAIRPHIRRSDT